MIDDQAVKDLIEIGVKPGVARRIVGIKDPGSSALLKLLASNIRGKSSTRAKVLSKRRDALGAAEARFVALQADLEAKQLDAIPALL